MKKKWLILGTLSLSAFLAVAAPQEPAGKEFSFGEAISLDKGIMLTIAPDAFQLQEGSIMFSLRGCLHGIQNLGQVRPKSFGSLSGHG